MAQLMPAFPATDLPDAFQTMKCTNPVIEQIYRERKLPCPDGSIKDLNVYIPREEGDYLYSLVRAVRPEITIEIGMANGLSTLFIAQALLENGRGRHIAIDPFQTLDWGGVGMYLLGKAQLASLVELIEKPSHQALPELEQQGLTARFIFIDGNHLFDYVISDFLCCDRILEVGGLMAFDDSDWPAITQVIRYALANRNYAVAFPEVVIENPRITPTLFGKVLRRAGKALPKLGAKLRPDFLVPSDELGVKGRCVVLRKLGDDDRDGQSKFHRPF